MIIPQLIGAGVGLVGGLLQDSKMKRMEDEITKKARQKHEASLEAINSFNPQAAARQADIGLAMQQDAATSNALNAATAGQANAGMGGNVQAPNAAAVGNSSAAISAAGQFAGARSQNAMQAAQMTQQKNSQLDQNAAAYGQLAKDVNLIHEDTGIGSKILGAIAGAGSGAGIMGMVSNSLSDANANVTTLKPKDKPAPLVPSNVTASGGMGAPTTIPGLSNWLANNPAQPGGGLGFGVPTLPSNIPGLKSPAVPSGPDPNANDPSLWGNQPFDPMNGMYTYNDPIDPQISPNTGAGPTIPGYLQATPGDNSSAPAVPASNAGQGGGTNGVLGALGSVLGGGNILGAIGSALGGQSQHQGQQGQAITQSFQEFSKQYPPPQGATQGTPAYQQWLQTTQAMYKQQYGLP